MNSNKVVPEPVKTDSRSCFGIEFFRSEEEAQKFHEHVRERGDTYNGGFFHGMRCGRDRSFDHDDPVLGHLYAVTTR